MYKKHVPFILAILPPLFIPLKTQYYEAFEDGNKVEELRLYGKRWNENVCKVGRRVILSKGYGKKSRLNGVIEAIKVQHGTTFGKTYQEALKDVYGDLNITVIVIRIKILRELKDYEEKSV